MKILLLSPNRVITPYPVYPIGLDYVAGSIPTGHEVRVADLNVTSLAALDCLLADFAPDIIGISCRNLDNTEVANSRSFIQEYTDLVSRLRSRSDAIIVIGGSGFSIMPRQMLSELGADYGMVGEGERFGLLVEAIAAGKPPAETIPGIIGQQTDDQITTPVPWHGEQTRNFSKSSEHAGFYLEKGGMLNLQSKRGCSFKCIYCSYPAIEGAVHRLYVPETVAETALRLQEAGAKYLFITDSAFNSDIQHSLAVARAFKEVGVTIPWGGFFAPVKLPQDYFSTLAECGLSHVEFGTESLSNTVLKSYRKPFRVSDVFTAHAQARDARLHVAHYFLLGGPGETMETLAESLDNAEQLEKTVFFFFTGMRIYPQTALYDIALQEGLITDTTDLLVPVFYHNPNIPDYQAIEDLVKERAAGRINWVVGSGEEQSGVTVTKLHERGFVGPLWEYLAR
ncbi:lipid biosynthesis B12-binding/radical SAM protein [Desulfogranum japonicum]|uniref:lipid biosynthesis B12-binding/radical SAM protein n=1 Tax=Desulfogranum japonicum TaxID=231447 RepID=UPI000425C020|nr:lipid biosynthesis B12-binding/radical SAM protein [Desulfogranum japonicum]